MTNKFTLLSETDFKILQIVIEEPMPIMNLVSKLGLVHTHILDRLYNLQKNNLIDRNKVGRTVLISATIWGCYYYLLTHQMWQLGKEDYRLFKVEKNQIIITANHNIKKIAPKIIKRIEIIQKQKTRKN
ncbi:hypothetical protein HOC35_01715 [Candidatus Woesearchaeota archaeon]|jgi:predicted transcriptional regulator|nr:hypothetical protein [Candidatus Woesearchaeota archaeon]